MTMYEFIKELHEQGFMSFEEIRRCMNQTIDELDKETLEESVKDLEAQTDNLTSELETLIQNGATLDEIRGVQEEIKSNCRILGCYNTELAKLYARK